MREILFRGKRPDTGEWVYGWYCPTPFGRLPLKDAIVPSEEATDGYYTFVKVMPDTIGQFTGLLDKTGKKIFEGDILKIMDTHDNTVMYEVAYKSASFVVNQIGVNFCTHLDDFPDGYFAIEVVGNIHDNPALVGGESE